MNIEQLQELFPKWRFFKINKSVWINSGEFECQHLKSDIIDNMMDIYNSIDFVVEFLISNGFEREYNGNHNFYIYNSDVSIRIFINANYYLLSVNNKEYIELSFDELIGKIKELINYEMPFKSLC